MILMSSNNWSTVPIRTQLYKRIKDIVGLQVDPTITSPSQFIDLALRDTIERMERQRDGNNNPQDGTEQTGLSDKLKSKLMGRS